VYEVLATRLMQVLVMVPGHQPVPFDVCVAMLNIASPWVSKLDATIATGVDPKPSTLNPQP
jgi:hypothetical protein